MSVPALGQEGLQNGLSRLLMQAVLGGGGRCAEGLLEEGHAHALSPADVPQGRRGPGLPLTISANSASRTEMTLPSWASPATDCSRNARCSAERSDDFSGKTP